jgi:ferrochelatase
LIVNLGTPAAPDRKSVGRFLYEFLSDPLVVDLPRWLWLPLLRLVIVPLRSGRSAKAYRKIWSREGSPLLVLTQSLVKAVQEKAGDEHAVVCGMRYGEPSIHDGLNLLRTQGVTELVLLPLFPQFSDTTTRSVENALGASMSQLDWHPELTTIRDYHQTHSWIQAIASSINSFQASHGKPDKLLFSMHGIPERYVANGDPYQKQCEAGIALVTNELGLDASEWILTYQSRVGREPWLQPYTDVTLAELAKSGVRHIQVVCPGFAVDCLETLEEIAMQNRSLFIDSGGENLEYIPALNDSPAHVEVMLDLLNL